MGYMKISGAWRYMYTFCIFTNIHSCIALDKSPRNPQVFYYKRIIRKYNAVHTLVAFRLTTTI